MVRLSPERTDQVHNRLTVLHQKVVAIWNDWSGTVGVGRETWRDL